MRLQVAALALAAAASASVLARQLPDSSRQYRFIMGTSVAVEASGGTADVRRLATEEIFQAFAEIDRLMSNYRQDSELTAVNRRAASEPVIVSDPTMSVLAAAEQVSRASNGAFDATIGPAVRLWGFRDRTPHVPSASELAAIRPLVDYRNVQLDRGGHTVRFTRPGVEIDLGGIAKGFAVEVGANILRRRGLSGLVDAGGNQYFVGLPMGKRAWSVGVKDPDAPDRLLGVIETPETSASTSADYANFLVSGGRTYGHLLDPRTLAPSTAALSATIISRDGTLADAMSKAAFVLGPQAGLALIESMPGMAGIIAYRKPDGRVGLAISQRLSSAFHPVPHRS